jgi:phosphonate transport system permease protein
MTRNTAIMARHASTALFFGTLTALSAFYILVVATDWPRVSSFSEAVSALERFFPPNLDAIPGLFWPTVDTILMAFFATLLISIIAPPIIWLSARNITPNIVTFFIGRTIVIVTRSVHELVWGVLFVIAVGLGPLPGILALAVRDIGFVTKVVAEEVEAVDLRPVEALQAAGASSIKVLILAIIPQVLPVYIGTLIFQWEINLRRAAVIGVVGAGGLGLAFHQAMIQFKWREATAIVVILVILVLIGEVLSRQLRKRII